MDIYPSCVVKSMAGRDKGKYFVVMEQVDENYVTICDGDLRPVERAKKKKRKHLKPMGKDIAHIKEKLDVKGKVSNREVRKDLKLALAEAGLIEEGI